jgi:ferrous iron transport protein A
MAQLAGVGAGPRSVRDLRRGASAVLAEVALGRAQRVRLAELGLRAGETVTVVQRSVGGARVIAVHGSRIAVDAGTAAGLLLTDEVTP